MSSDTQGSGGLGFAPAAHSQEANPTKTQGSRKGRTLQTQERCLLFAAGICRLLSPGSPTRSSGRGELQPSQGGGASPLRAAPAPYPGTGPGKATPQPPRTLHRVKAAPSRLPAGESRCCWGGTGQRRDGPERGGGRCSGERGCTGGGRSTGESGYKGAGGSTGERGCKGGGMMHWREGMQGGGGMVHRREETQRWGE